MNTHDELAERYDAELRYLRRLGAEFADQHGEEARRLKLERETKTPDPHVERLLQGFAFLAARVHLKLDNDLPELSEAFLNVLYPNHLKPVPSMTLVEFQLDPQVGSLPEGFAVSRDTELVSKDRLRGVPCLFRTVYDTTLWPVTVESVKWARTASLRLPHRLRDATWSLQLKLRCLPGNSFEELHLSKLRWFLGGVQAVAGTLYELLCNSCVGVVVRSPTDDADPLVLPPSALSPVGFAAEEAILPNDSRVIPAYGWLQEYFTLPEKFWFVDLHGLESIKRTNCTESAEFVFLFDRFERSERESMLQKEISTDALRLSCTPAVNLFKRRSEPIQVTHRAPQYLLVPNARQRRTTEIFSVDSVNPTGVQAEPIRFEPFYSWRHGVDRSGDRVFWYARRVSKRVDRDRLPDDKQDFVMSDVYLTFADLTAEPIHLSIDAVDADVTCFNGELAQYLPGGCEFDRQGGGPIEKVIALRQPTQVVYPPLGKPSLWRLVSMATLNLGSLVNGGPDALRELLRLHDPGLSDDGEKHIQGISNVKSVPWYSRIESEHGLTFARGHKVEVDFDEGKFGVAGPFVLATVLERLFGLCTGLNSFTVTSVRTLQRQKNLRQWPPRSGRKALL